jgi:arylsulfatase A-like enzyme
LSFAEAVIFPQFVVSVMADGWKLVYDEERSRTELFDLSTDPHERIDLSAERPEILRELQDAIESHLTRSEAVANTGSTGSDIDGAVESQLARLGYLE